MVENQQGLALEREWALREELLRRKASRFDFLEYITYIDSRYKVIATQKNKNIHELIIRTLEDVALWKLKRLRMSIPPRTWKSEVGGIKLPTWFVGRDPTKSFVLASYDANLASDFWRKARDIVMSKKYKNVFPTFELASDRNTQTHRETVQRWWMYTVWVWGALTWKGWNLLYIDDPIKNMEEAQSPVIQEKVWDRYDSVLSTRKQDENTAIVVTMTRWHMQDLAGKLKEKEKEGWDKFYDLTIKAIDDEWYPIIWPGKRWPDYFFKEREVRTPKVWNALFQQDPIMMTGAIFKPGNERWFHESDFEKVWWLNKSDIELGIFVDPAFSTNIKSDDCVVRVVWQHKQTRDIYFFDIFAETQAPSVARQYMFALAAKREMKWFNRPFFSIERSTINKDQNKFYKDFMDEMIKRNQMYTVYEYRPKWQKMSRIRDYLEPFRSQNKLYYNIDLPPEQQKKILDQYHQFPNIKHDDICLIWDMKIITLFWNKNIKDIKIWEYVYTPYGFRKVLFSWCTGESEIIENRWLIGTPWHNVFILDKWYCKLSEIQSCDRVSIFNLSNILKWKLRNLLNSIEKPINLCDEKESIISNTKQRTNWGNELNDCMSQFGNFITNKMYLKGMMFIIKIIIHLIITLIIWSWLKVLNIIANIWRIVGKIYETTQNKLNILKISENLPKNGIEVKNEKNGIKNIIKKITINYTINNLLLSVKSVVKNLWQKNQSESIIAPHNVEFNEEKLQENVSYVEQSIEQIHMRDDKHVIQNAEKNIRSKKEKVYNITVEWGHCYYANNFLVANCDVDTQAIIQFMAWIRNKTPWEKEETVYDPITWLPMAKSAYNEQQRNNNYNKSNGNMVIEDPITWKPMSN